MAEQHSAWQRIEPEAQELARHHDLIPGEHAIELSKAISLKRIADALNPVDGTNIAGSLYYIEQAMAAGR